jgi:hypothetical protein
MCEYGDEYDEYGEEYELYIPGWARDCEGAAKVDGLSGTTGVWAETFGARALVAVGTGVVDAATDPLRSQGLGGDAITDFGLQSR